MFAATHRGVRALAGAPGARNRQPLHGGRRRATEWRAQHVVVVDVIRTVRAAMAAVWMESGELLVVRSYAARGHSSA